MSVNNQLDSDETMSIVAAWINHGILAGHKEATASSATRATSGRTAMATPTA